MTIIDIKVVMRCLGDELCAIRNDLGLTQAEAVALVKQKTGMSIVWRTLLSYEHGIRILTVPRLFQLAQAYGQSAPMLLAAALQRASGEPYCCPCRCSAPANDT